jgi:hypothetical protein
MGGKPRFGSFLVIEPSSVIVFQIDVDGIAFRPAERDPPFSTGIDRIATSVAPDQCMKAKTPQLIAPCSGDAAIL